MVHVFAVFGAGNIALAAFLGATSMALLRAERGAGWLAGWGLLNAALTAAGTAWLVSGDSEGPLTMLSAVSRVSFLAWVVAAGIWLMRGKVHGATPA